MYTHTHTRLSFFFSLSHSHSFTHSFILTHFTLNLILARMFGFHVWLRKSFLPHCNNAKDAKSYQKIIGKRVRQCVHRCKHGMKNNAQRSNQHVKCWLAHNMQVDTLSVDLTPECWVAHKLTVSCQLNHHMLFYLLAKERISTILENKNVKKQKLEKKLEKSTREAAATTTTITTTTTTTHKV